MDFKPGTKPRGPSLTTQMRRRQALLRDPMPDVGDAQDEEPSEKPNGELVRAALVFDPWLQCDSLFVNAIANNIAGNFSWLDKSYGKGFSVDRYEAISLIVRTIFANLTYAVACGHEPPAVAVSLRAAKQKRTRYDRQNFTQLPRTLELLTRTRGLPSYFTLQKSSRKGVGSVITAGLIFHEMVRDYRIKPSQFSQALGSELIKLSRTSQEYGAGGGRETDWIDYQETAETKRYRDEIVSLNTFLASASVTFVPDKGPEVQTWRTTLRRYFKLRDGDAERFDLGGRLFGGWWQDLEKHRRKSIRIQGQPIADLDFSNMFLRLAYAEAGEVPPEGDLYALPGRLGDTRWRDGIKIIANTMLFRSGPLIRLPRDADLRTKLPSRAGAPEVRDAILAAHPKLAGIFENGIGLRLMFLESQILVVALLRLRDQDVPALGMHDGLMVARSHADLAADVMADAAACVIGHRLPISLKSPPV